MGEAENQQWGIVLGQYLNNNESADLQNGFAQSWRDMPLRSDVIKDVIEGCHTSVGGFKEIFKIFSSVPSDERDQDDIDKARYCYAWTRGFALAMLDVLYSVDRAQAMSYCHNLAVRKHADYGSDNILGFGELGIIIRTSDKISRMQNLLLRDGTAQFESITDTLYDTVVYCTYGMILQDGKWIA
jgi:hypothetical protein